MADQFHNVGKDVIEAFLQGAALRQRREEGAARSAIQMEQAKLAQKRIDMNLAQFQERMEETKRVHDSQIQLRDLQQKFTDAKIADLEFKLLKGGGEAIKEGLLEPDPAGPPGALRRTAKGQAILTQAENLKVLNVPKLDYAKALGQDRLGNNLVMEGVRAANAVDLQGRRFVQQSTENSLERAKDLKIANMMAGLAQKRIDDARNKPDKKEETIEEIVENNRAGVMAWDRAAVTRAIPGGVAGAQIAGRYQKEGIVVPTPKHLDWMEQGAGPHASFIRDIYAMKQIIDAIPKAKSYKEKLQLAADYKQLRDNQSKNLESIAKANGVTGVLTNEDVARQWTNFPELAPGGILAALIAHSTNATINADRINKAINVYEKAMRVTTGGMSPKQLKLVTEKFGLLSKAELDSMRPNRAKPGAAKPKLNLNPEDVSNNPRYEVRP